MNKILNSKRLLIDHVECLETCLGALNLQTKQNFTSILCKTAISSTSLILSRYYVPKEKLIFKTTLTAIFSGFTIFYCMKTIFKIHHKIIENSLDSFIKSLEAFSNCIKKNIVYFNEIQMMNSISKTNNNIE